MHNTILSIKTKSEVINNIYPYLLTTFPLLLIAASIIFFKFYGHVNNTYLILWFITLFTLSTCQFALGVWFQKTKYNLEWEHLSFKLLVINAALIGTLWGIVSIVFMPNDTVGQSYLIFVMAFIAAGGLIYLTGSSLVGSMYVTCILIPLAGSVYFTLHSQLDNAIYFNITLGIFCYWAFLLAVNYYGSKLYAENLTQRSIINKLSDDLSQTVEELEEINLISRTEKEKRILTQIYETVKTEKYNTALNQYTDVLTGTDTQEILNIKFFQSRAHARRHHQGIAIFYIDVSNFNSVKAKLGESSNLVLKAVAMRLQYCKRESDILARSDENKFILILSEVLLGNEIKAVTSRIFKTLDEDIIINDGKIKISVNIGISLFPIDGQDLQELVKEAKIALSYLSSDESSQPHFKIYDRKEMGLVFKN